MPPVHPELVEGRRGRPALAGRGWTLMADSSWFAGISKLKLFILPLPPSKGGHKMNAVHGSASSPRTIIKKLSTNGSKSAKRNRFVSPAGGGGLL